jgi:hypothetical protein
MARLYGVSLSSPVVPMTVPIVIDTKLSTMGDWIRLNQFQWFVFSDRTKTEVAEQVSASIATSDHVVVTVIASEFAQGNAPQWIWDWLNEKMSKQIIGT